MSPAAADEAPSDEAPPGEGSTAIRAVFFGSGRFAVPILNALVALPGITVEHALYALQEDGAFVGHVPTAAKHALKSTVAG